MPFRFVKENGDQLEIVPSISGLGFLEENVNEFYGLGLMGGYNILLGEHFAHLKSRVIKNYISPKFGAIFTRRVVLLSAALTWHREVFFPKDYYKSRSLDLGLRINYALGDVNALGNGDIDIQVIGVFFRVDWNWFRRSDRN